VALGLGLFAVVGVAYATGLSLWAPACVKLTGLASFVAITLGLVAAFRRPPAGETPVERAAGGALLGWVALAAATDQFAWVWDTRGVVSAVAWLVPPAVGGLVLPRQGKWLAGLGCWAALFAGTAALTCTVSHTSSGAGLFFVWLE
jgi:hypothetical protein